MSYQLGLIYKDILWKKWKEEQMKKKKSSTKPESKCKTKNPSTDSNETH